MAIVVILAMLVSCKKTGKKCIQVKYVMSYCLKAGASLVALCNPNIDATVNGKQVYEMALLNVSKSFQIKDKVFYINYHYDVEKAKFDNNICPAVVGPAPIFVCDSASETDCND
ncbi:hypothetical protein [Pedobacter sp. UYEF25]